ASQLSSLGVGRAVRARLRPLPPGCAALARAVAVLGDPAEPILATQLASLDDATAAGAADALVEAAIFEPGRELAFVHPLVRSSVYAELSSQERARHHERAARLRAEAANALGSALFLAHRPDEAMTDLTAVINELPASEREQGLRLQATRWTAVRGNVAVWRSLQATGERFVVTPRTPRTVGERLNVAVAAYDAARAGTARKAPELALRACADG